MAQDFTAFRKISFQTVDVEVALAEIEYQYLKFICEATLRNSDEVLREQIRHLHIGGLPSFDEWRKQGDAAGLLLPAIETNTIPMTAIESNDSAVNTPVKPSVEPETPKASDRKPAQTAAPAAKPATQPPGSATGKLVKALAEQASAKLSSRIVIEQQHELLSAVLKEGKSYDDLATILTNNGAKISASTLRNYLSAARQLAKKGKTPATKPVESNAKAPIAVAPAPETTTATAVAPATASASAPSITATAEPTPAPVKPTRGRPKAAAKTQFERETSVTSGSVGKKSSSEKAAPIPAPKRRQGRG